MKFIFNIPGPLLVFFGAICLSFGGLIVKSFEGANLWQILFWRQLFFAIIVIVFLLIIYKKSFFRSFYNIGFIGVVAGFALAFGFSAYVFSMYKTTVANTNFIIATETIFLALFGYIFLKEKINTITFISIFIGLLGILLILGSSLSIQSEDEFMGNIVAFLMPISLAILVIIIRKNPSVDMVPAQFIAAIITVAVGFVMVDEITISSNDLFLASIAGVFQVGFGFILITIGSKSTASAVVGILMLSEAVFGPLWAWLFINELMSISILLGGCVIIFSILLQSFYGK